MKTIFRILMSAWVIGSGQFAFAQETPAEKAREILESNKAALVVVTVRGNLVATTDGEPLPEREQQRRTLGVTIGEDGLIVVSNSAIDASIGLEGQQARVKEEDLVTIRSAKTEFLNVEISYGDTTLLNGRIVRQDAEADVAFVMPDASEAAAANKNFDYVDFSDFAATAQVADQVVGLSRASGVYGYMPIVEVGRITGVFKGDRTYFVNEAGNGQGIPVFTLDGKPVGVTVVRIIDGQPSGVLGTLSAGSIQIMANLAREAAK
ncbi:MAG: hypothetical protein AAGA96_15090 [Verrucomicrobiota bacterium]